MRYEFQAGVLGDYFVFAISERPGAEGQSSFVMFSGPDSRQLAEEYAAWKKAEPVEAGKNIPKHI